MELKQDVTHGTWDYPFEVHHTKLSDGLTLYPHLHNEFEITCVIEGEGTFWIDGQEYPVKQGDLLFIPSGSIHLAMKTKSVPAAFFSIVFSPDFFCMSMANRIAEKYIKPVLNRSLLFKTHLDGTEQWHKEALQATHQIASFYAKKDCELLCQSALLQLWHLFYHHKETIDEKKTFLPSLRLKESIDYMHTHFSEQITIHELAAISNMSDSHYSRTFREYMKISPIEYLIQLRVQESAKKLKESDLPIGEVALACGFHDFSYFGKHFRKRMNCSPREYRKFHMENRRNL